MLTVTEPAVSHDLTTIEAVKAEISTDNDPLLALMVTQASKAIADHCGRVLALETVQETIRGDQGAGRLMLARWPVASISSITENGTALATEDYELDAANGLVLRLRSDRRACWSAGKIVATYDGGYDGDEIPEPLARACIELVKAWWNAKSRDAAVRGLEYSDGSNIQYQVGNPALPPLVADLVAPYVNRRLV